MSLIDRYNKLLCHQQADKVFQRQLMGDDREYQDREYRQALRHLLSILAPLFSNGKYAVWLLHGHYNLEVGEQMISRSVDKASCDICNIVHPERCDIMQSETETSSRIVPERCDIMQSATETSSRIVPERWDNTGEVLEHRLLADGDDLPSPPPPTFWVEFKQIMKDRKMTMLGVCYAPDKKVQDQLRCSRSLFLETTGHGNRRHHTLFQDTPVPPPFVIETAWIPRDFPDTAAGDSGTPVPSRDIAAFSKLSLFTSAIPTTTDVATTPLSKDSSVDTVPLSYYLVDGCSHICSPTQGGHEKN